MGKAKAASQVPPKAKARKANTSKPSKHENVGPNENDGRIPLELQQKCLNIFRDALRPSVEDVIVLQEIKACLFDRDFATAFGKEGYLRVYASRWSPSRALGYLQVLITVQEHMLPNQDPVRPGHSNHVPLEMVCLGGGAGAEVVALAGWWSMVSNSMPALALQACFVDIAGWHTTVEALHKRCVNAPELSQYASATAREANVPLLSEKTFPCKFQQQDVLQWPDDALQSVVLPTTKLVTLFFTLNELYSTSVPEAQRLLSQLTAAMSTDSLLLVVDSPGSYSTVSLNGGERRYPMLWLLDHTLTTDTARKAGDASTFRWEKVMSDESKWFRLPPGLEYPIELEDMRYQIHLYRRLAAGSDG
ncbi:hypothetical protein LTR12_008591 [Friedmanniomyces endolithicus]|nr:hypothetical protein LTR74_003146 [Friedmanniomyces endolithicus]KAK1816991.1 hypothetical protein LTR12_008591 [Friedmanniomyces endolithicus]